MKPAFLLVFALLLGITLGDIPFGLLIPDESFQRRGILQGIFDAGKAILDIPIKIIETSANTILYMFTGAPKDTSTKQKEKVKNDVSPPEVYILNDKNNKGKQKGKGPVEKPQKKPDQKQPNNQNNMEGPVQAQQNPNRDQDNYQDESPPHDIDIPNYDDTDIPKHDDIDVSKHEDIDRPNYDDIDIPKHDDIDRPNDDDADIPKHDDLKDEKVAVPSENLDVLDGMNKIDGAIDNLEEKNNDVTYDLLSDLQDDISEEEGMHTVDDEIPELRNYFRYRRYQF